jgi:hypothetical protein
MTKILHLTGLLICVWQIAGAQQYKFNHLRQDDDYRFLRNNISRSWYKGMKYNAFGSKGGYLSMGGEIRHQAFFHKNGNWGETQNDKDAYVFSRFIYHADLHLAKTFRGFLQFQSSLATAKANTGAVDEDPLDLQQAFIDIDLLNRYTGTYTLRIGRQEMSYGSEKLVSARDAPNNRQAFDGVKMMVKGDRASADIFYSHHVKDKKGIFDDLPDLDVRFYGGYISMTNVPIVEAMDMYYLGLMKTGAVFDDGEGNEWRHSIGGRLYGGNDSWLYDLEAVYQFGEFAGKMISAWSLASNTGYKFTSAKLQPYIGIKTDVTSGDNRPGDDKLETFNPLFPRGAYFGLAALIDPVNLINVHPTLTLTLIEDQLKYSIEYDAFFRLSVNDGLYGPDVTLTYSGKGTKSRFIGQQLITHADYNPNRFLGFRIEAILFRSESFLKEVSPGRDMLFFNAMAQLKF